MHDLVTPIVEPRECRELAADAAWAAVGPRRRHGIPLSRIAITPCRRLTVLCGIECLGRPQLIVAIHIWTHAIVEQRACRDRPRRRECLPCAITDLTCGPA